MYDAPRRDGLLFLEWLEPKIQEYSSEFKIVEELFCTASAGSHPQRDKE
jgi:hypothetical protein